MSELLNFILNHEEAFQSPRRLASLYSDFRFQRAVNPDGYAANISAWRKALTKAARAGLIPAQSGNNNDLLTISTGEELLRALETDHLRRPLALGAVIQDAVAKKEMIPLKDFFGAKTSIYRQGWFISPWQVISWSLRQLGIVGESDTTDKLAAGSFVIVANVESAAAAILKRVSESASRTDLIFSRETFVDEFSHVLNQSRALSPTDLEILLKFLSRDKHIIAYDGRTIKFAPPSSTVPPSPITQQDTTIASLRTLISSLRIQTAALTDRIANLDEAARAAVARKARTAALSSLRSKKLAEATLARRTDTLAQLEDVLAKIEAAADHVEVVRMMNASTAVLKSLHEEVGGVEGVEGVVEALTEEMQKVDEVGRVVNEAAGEAVDEGEVDEEMERLEREEKEAVEAEEAEKTRKRLDAVRTPAEAVENSLENERPEAKATEKQKQEVQINEATKDATVDQEAEALGRLSLDENRPTSPERTSSKDAIAAE